MNKNDVIADYYSRHRSQLVQMLTVRTSDADVAQDMVQDVFLRLLNGFPLITPQTLPNLVHTMLRNRMTDYFRHRQILERYEHQVRRMAPVDDSAEHIISVQHVIQKLEYSMAHLSEDHGKIYRLHVLDGMKVGEIAQQLELSYKQVENRLCHARKEVRRRMCV